MCARSHEYLYIVYIIGLCLLCDDVISGDVTKPCWCASFRVIITGVMAHRRVL